MCNWASTTHLNTVCSTTYFMATIDSDWKEVSIPLEEYRLIQLPRGSETDHLDFTAKINPNRKVRGWSAKASPSEEKEQALQALRKTEEKILSAKIDI